MLKIQNNEIVDFKIKNFNGRIFCDGLNVAPCKIIKN